jgi:hypothetical protein
LPFPFISLKWVKLVAIVSVVSLAAKIQVISRHHVKGGWHWHWDNKAQMLPTLHYNWQEKQD